MHDNIPEKELTREDLEREFAKRKDLQRLIRILKILKAINWIKIQINFSVAYYIGLLFLGGSAFSILGLEYNTLSSLIRFLTIYFFVTIPTDWVFDAFFDIVKERKIISDSLYKLLYIMTDIPLNMVIIGIIESHLSYVCCSMGTAFLFCVIYSIVTLAIFDDGCIYLRD